MAVKLWPTPAARDHKGANGEEHLENGTGRLHLDQLPNFVAHLWATPRANEGEKAGQWQRDKSGNIALTLTGQALSRQDPETPTHGEASSPSTPTSRRQLSPDFVEWLMGWPPGWTSFGCSETGLCRWRQAMRSELSALDCTPAAPPAQMSLWG